MLVSTENPMMSKLSDDIPAMPHENLMSQSKFLSNVVSILTNFFRMADNMFPVLQEVQIWISGREISSGKITPDLVCQLLVQDLQSFGVTCCSDIMALQIKCTTFSGKALKKSQATFGAPSFFVPKSMLETLLGEGFFMREVSAMLSVS